MKTKVFYLFCVLIGFTSCNSEELSMETTAESNTRHFSKQEIITKANYYYSLLSEHTRSEAPEVETILSIGSKTRGDSGEGPSYYLVNYEDNAGFAIVGGNTNSHPLLAVSDEGNLEIDDVNNIEILNRFITASTQLSAPIDTLTPKPNEPYNISINPKISPLVRKWGQRAPFNASTPLIDGQHTLTGCAPLAAAILMSYHEWPEIYRGLDIKWKNVKQGDVGRIPTLIAAIGDSTNMKTEYGLSGSNTWDYNIRPGIRNCGFTGGTTISLNSISFSPTEESKTTIDSMLPFYVIGVANIPGYPRPVGHAWIIDGLLHIPHDPDNILNPNPNPDAYYMHCIWGHFGKGNGFYLVTGLNEIGGVRYLKYSTDGTYPGYEDEDTYPVFYSLECIYGFKKSYSLGGFTPIL